jgi:hypothetical protein
MSGLTLIVGGTIVIIAGSATGSSLLIGIGAFVVVWALLMGKWGK